MNLDTISINTIDHVLQSHNVTLMLDNWRIIKYDFNKPILSYIGFKGKTTLHVTFSHVDPEVKRGIIKFIEVNITKGNISYKI